MSARDPSPGSVGLVDRFIHPNGLAYFPRVYELPCTRSPAPVVGRRITFPLFRLPYSRMVWSGSAGRSAWNQGLAYRKRVYPVCLSDRARSMLQGKHGVPSGAFGVFGRLHLRWVRRAGND